MCRNDSSERKFRATHCVRLVGFGVVMSPSRFSTLDGRNGLAGVVVSITERNSWWKFVVIPTRQTSFVGLAVVLVRVAGQAVTTNASHNQMPMRFILDGHCIGGLVLSPAAKRPPSVRSSNFEL